MDADDEQRESLSVGWNRTGVDESDQIPEAEILRSRDEKATQHD